jgi:hypothetical protein
MGEIAVGDKVRFRPGSYLPAEWEIAPDAIGQVKRRHVEHISGRVWLDIDFGAHQGFLFAVDPGEFELVSGSS